MPVRVELWESSVLVDGVEEWWDGIERALLPAEGEYPILESISPYGDVRIPADRLSDLADECRRLSKASTGKVRSLLCKIADLCDRARETGDAELRFNGD
jgi:hypothetical protein